MKLLNKKYNYGLKLVLLSIDEGITGKFDAISETNKGVTIDFFRLS